MIAPPMKLALAGLGIAAMALVVAAPSRTGSQRQLTLRGPQKLTAGPLLGFVSGPQPTSAVKLMRIDPTTLRPSGMRALRLPFADAWAVAPGGRQLALAVHPHPVNESNTLELVRLPALRRQPLSVSLGGDVSALAWISPRQVVALVGKTLCCPARLSVVVVDLHSRRVVRRQSVAGTVLHIARSPQGLVLLTAPTAAIAPASLVIVDARGVRTVALGSLRAGEIPGEGGISRWRQPGLAVDAAGRNAYVVDPGGSLAEINLATFAVAAHTLSTRRSLLARIDAWLEPTASAKGDSGPVRQAQWLGNGFLLVTGSNLRDTKRRLASDPAGLELIDTRDWSEHDLASQADAATVANGLLLVTGARWRGNRNPTGMGLAAYAPDGKPRFTLFARRDVWIDHVANGRAYVAGYGWSRERVVDLRAGRVTGTRTTAATLMLLLGQGNTLG